MNVNAFNFITDRFLSIILEEFIMDLPQAGFEFYLSILDVPIDLK